MQFSRAKVPRPITIVLEEGEAQEFYEFLLQADNLREYPTAWNLMQLFYTHGFRKSI